MLGTMLKSALRQSDYAITANNPGMSRTDVLILELPKVSQSLACFVTYLKTDLSQPSNVIIARA